MGGGARQTLHIGHARAEARGAVRRHAPADGAVGGAPTVLAHLIRLARHLPEAPHAVGHKIARRRIEVVKRAALRRRLADLLAVPVDVVALRRELVRHPAHLHARGVRAIRRRHRQTGGLTSRVKTVPPKAPVTPAGAATSIASASSATAAPTFEAEEGRQLVACNPRRPAPAVDVGGVARRRAHEQPGVAEGDRLAEGVPCACVQGRQLLRLRPCRPRTLEEVRSAGGGRIAVVGLADEQP